MVSDRFHNENVANDDDKERKKEARSEHEIIVKHDHHVLREEVEATFNEVAFDLVPNKMRKLGN